MMNRGGILSFARRTFAASLVVACLTAFPTTPTSAVFAQEADRSAAITEGKWLDRETVGVGVIEAERIRKWPLFVEMRKRGAFRGPEQSIQHMLGCSIDEVERVVVAVDNELIRHAAKAFGFAPAGSEAAEPTAGEVHGNLRMIALAFHNYHDVYGKLPRADGDGEGRKTGLSWRVHILPFIEEAPLYQQFHLDEAWDSPHNKALVEKMPAFFRTPGVKEPGKTALHVFTGKGTAFEGKQGKKFEDFTDGLSNSLAAVAAAPETAVEWTKPGGLEFDPKTCRDLLGKFESPGIQVVMADGAVRSIASTIRVEALALLIQINDGQQLGPLPVATGRQPPPTPVVLLTSTGKIDPSRFAKFPSRTTVEGETIYGSPMFSAWIASERTLVIGSPESLKRLVQNQKSKSPTTSAALAHLVPGGDLTIGVDTASQSSLIRSAAEAAKNPLVDVLTSVTAISVQANVSQPAGGKLLELVAVTADQEASENLLTAVSSSLDQIRKALAGAKAAIASTPEGQKGRLEAEKGRQLAVKAFGSAEVKRDGNRVTLRVPVPEGFDTLPDLAQPLLPPGAADAAARTERKNNMKRVAIAFHNYHEVNGAFPGAGRPAGRDGAAVDKKLTGLSWRVHVLPYLNEAALYKQFHLDEPWDSEHNKTLIEKMPAVYRTAGVEKRGETAIHVFTGKGAPFSDDRTPRIRDFTDGTSNALLSVEAAPDKAEAWTKPGGLDFDPKKPIEALGALPEKTFLAVLADGSVQNVAMTVNPDLLRRMILFQDGEPLR